MRVVVRTVFGSALALLAAVMLALTSSVTSAFTVTAVAQTTALIMGGTGDPLTPPRDTQRFVQRYMNMAVDNYIAPSAADPDTGIATGPYNAVAVIYPARFNDPRSDQMTYDESVALGRANLQRCLAASGCEYNTGVGSDAPAADDDFVVFGYSQSATIATLEKRRLAALYPEGEGPEVDFVFNANGNRPNGGLLARGPMGLTIPAPFIFAGATFSGPTPTDTQYRSTDTIRQYDLWADVPVNPLNLLAMANWYASNVHFDYDKVSLDDPGIVDQGTYGDTSYYMVPTKILPLLQQMAVFPVIGPAVADFWDAPLRVLVEAAYDRTSSPGQHVGWNPLYFPNPLALGVNLAVAFPTGFDNLVESLLGFRPLGTVRPGPYGVGGPEVTYTESADTASEARLSALTVDAETSGAEGGSGSPAGGESEPQDKDGGEDAGDPAATDEDSAQKSEGGSDESEPGTDDEGEPGTEDGEPGTDEDGDETPDGADGVDDTSGATPDEDDEASAEDDGVDNATEDDADDVVTDKDGTSPSAGLDATTPDDTSPDDTAADLATVGVSANSTADNDSGRSDGDNAE